VRGEGGTHLTFAPEGYREQTVDLKVLRSRYVQPFGTFSGRIVTGGVAYAIDGVPGVAEDHDALW